MKLEKIKTIALTLGFLVVAMVAGAKTWKGKVVDKSTKEPLIGATILVQGTTKGTTTDVDGNFVLNLDKGLCVVEVSYVSYQTKKIGVDIKSDTPDAMIELDSDQQAIESVSVVGRRNLETEGVLQNERLKSTVAIENIGAKELSSKGISNVQEGVKKMTGISVASAGQIVVRGLGDRYSLTTLNGQPIASPNPDNKLIPLDIFPVSAVKNITVSKVYNVESYADYSGAHIDIASKDLAGDKLFTLGFSVGAGFNTIGKDFYSMDNTSLLSQPRADDHVLNHTWEDYGKAEFDKYVKANEPFSTSYSTTKSTGLPTFGGNLAWGDSFGIGSSNLSILLAGGVNSDNETTLGSYERTIDGNGIRLSEFTSDEYESELKMSGLANISLSFNDVDRISYTMFAARNASEKYMYRRGIDEEEKDLIGSTNVNHIYKLITNQLTGQHTLSDVLKLNWSTAYNMSSSDEPDRRQIMFQNSEDGELHVYTFDSYLNQRFFAYLTENDWNASASLDYTFNDVHKLNFGVAYKDKSRDFQATKFYYNLMGFYGETVDNIYDVNYITQDKIASGFIDIDRDRQPRDGYDSNSSITSAYLSTDLSYDETWLINLGVRYEESSQTVNYFDDQSQAGTRTLENNKLLDGLFPTMNIKYNFNKENLVRLSVSRTVTRPSFIEMAPFQYQESHGSVFLRGNELLENGYNYNFDLRYERFLERGDMFSVSAYFKYLDSPIERVQQEDAIHTFRNANHGTAGGIEFEARKYLAEGLRLGVNGSYMYTNVKLPSDGAYTNKERELQGASPYLFNVDLTYAIPVAEDDRTLNLALLYNYQGRRIHSVGLYPMGDVMQKAVNKMNFVATYNMTKKIDLKLQLSNLLNMTEEFEQQIPTSDEWCIVERYKPGMSASLGLSMKF